MFNANSVRLRACRKRGGLDQAELSQLIGTSYSTVSRFERGESLPDVQQLIDVAGYIGRRAQSDP